MSIFRQKSREEDVPGFLTSGEPLPQVWGYSRVSRRDGESLLSPLDASVSSMPEELIFTADDLAEMVGKLSVYGSARPGDAMQALLKRHQLRIADSEDNSNHALFHEAGNHLLGPSGLSWIRFELGHRAVSLGKESEHFDCATMILKRAKTSIGDRVSRVMTTAFIADPNNSDRVVDPSDEIAATLGPAQQAVSKSAVFSGFTSFAQIITNAATAVSDLTSERSR